MSVHQKTFFARHPQLAMKMPTESDNKHINSSALFESFTRSQKKKGGEERKDKNFFKYIASNFTKGFKCCPH